VGLSPRYVRARIVSRSDTGVTSLVPQGYANSHSLAHMANTFTSIRIHVVFSTKNRETWIASTIEEDVWRYLGGICRRHAAKALHIGGVEDPVHVLVGLPPTLALSELMRRLKGESSKWISERWPKMKGFAWQDGYGAFSVGQSQVGDTIRYITNQREHHARSTFAEEFRGFVEFHDLPFA
jgi:putative transposase